MFYTASALLVLCFALLSSFAGSAVSLIALLLILGSVGQMFMQITLSNAISRTLPKEQTGIGMGLLSMLNFIAGAIGTGIYSKIVDQGSRTPWNPLNTSATAAVYSNIYLMLVVLLVAVLVLYQVSKAVHNKQKNPGRKRNHFAPRRYSILEVFDDSPIRQ
ncbi:hypothetical protein GCM10023228_07500 [Brevibacillus fulvus]|uniref:DHA2 family metal-tetracycline-proton antiporter-like MFS transporter n=2 Tax=Brevibacillus fulvus TaxID=1125967 RepID=A0A938XYA8_9BACL|nr:DHA2 family metal-tetracycline-proton antiporter-like MFS transporter [Brevibacillus fulvus]